MNDEDKKVFSKMAHKRWDGKTKEQRSEEMRAIRQKGILKQQELERKLASLSAK